MTYWLKLGDADQNTLLYQQVYASTQLTPRPVLVVVLHGDAPFNKPSYQYTFAQRVAQQNADVVAVALLRPGYTDSAGHHSAGQRGWTTGDNYTPAIVQAIATTIQQLKKRYHPRRVVLAGHSGGAVLAADVTSQYPDLIQAALLVSCPCDVDAFRRHMAAYEGSWLWWLPVERLSPIEVASQLHPSTSIRLVTGSADSIALSSYSHGYAAQLRKRGVPVHVIELTNQGHEIFLRWEVVAQLGRLL
ncbi:alpha/beta hydrolase family protein [Spirosoma harenae]